MPVAFDGTGRRITGRPIINGTLAPIRQSLSVHFDPNRGGVVTENWASAGDTLRLLQDECEAARIAYQLEATPVRSHLVLTATDERAGIGAYTADQWQLMANELLNDI